MLISFEKISIREKVACIGPNIFDEKSTSEYIQKGFIISSGTLYDINIFKKVGVFNAGWFIDMIDVEWCHRAQKMVINPLLSMKLEWNIILGKIITLKFLEKV